MPVAPSLTVALDDRTLYSDRLKLVGRPDRLVREGEWIVPEEWKSSKRVGDGHRLQLATYFLLIEEDGWKIDDVWNGEEESGHDLLDMLQAPLP